MGKLDEMRDRMRRVSRAFPLLFDPRTPVLFVLGAVLVDVVASGWYDLLHGLLGGGRSASFWALLIHVVLLALVVLSLYLVAASRHSTGAILGQEERATQREGLVVFLSTGTGKADEEALKFHADGGLKYAWLIATPEVEDEGKVARLAADYHEQGVVVDPRPLKNPRDANEAYLVVSNILDDAERRGLGPGQLYVDITGSLRPASVGATLACSDQQYDLEYVVCRYEHGKCVPGTSEVMEVRLSGARSRREPGTTRGGEAT